MRRPLLAGPDMTDPRVADLARDVADNFDRIADWLGTHPNARAYRERAPELRATLGAAHRPQDRAANREEPT